MPVLEEEKGVRRDFGREGQMSERKRWKREEGRRRRGGDWKEKSRGEEAGRIAGDESHMLPATSPAIKRRPSI